MNATRFADSERGIDDGERGLSTSPFGTDRSDGVDLARGGRRRAGRADQKTRQRGVIFLLSRRGHQQYLAQSIDVIDPEAARTGREVHANTLTYRDNINRALRRILKIDYDAFETREFSTFDDIVQARPSAQVRGGRWAGVYLVTHAEVVIVDNPPRAQLALWVGDETRDANDLHMPEADVSDPPFAERFEPGIDIHVVACGGDAPGRRLGCALRRMFGDPRAVLLPRDHVQIRPDGLLYVRVDEGRYRRFSDDLDWERIGAGECG